MTKKEILRQFVDKSTDIDITKTKIVIFFNGLMEEAVQEACKKLSNQHRLLDMYSTVKEHVMRYSENICNELSITKKFLDKSFELWWEGGFDSVLDTKY